MDDVYWQLLYQPYDQYDEQYGYTKVILPYAELNVEGMLQLSLKLESQL